MTGALSGIDKWCVSVVLILVIACMLIISCQSALAASNGFPRVSALPALSPTVTPTPVTLNPALSSGVMPRATVDPAIIGNVINSYYTRSPLLYVVGNNTVSVIEVNTNKVIDVIYFNPDIVLADAAVNGDYTRLYVLYYNNTEWEASPEYEYMHSAPDYYIDTIDLSDKQVVASTRQKGNGRYALYGDPVEVLLSKDGNYLYVMFVHYGLGQPESWLYRYDTAANAYTAAVHDLNADRSLVWVTDMELGDDGYLYIADRQGHAVYRITEPALDKFYRYFLWDYHSKEKLLWGLDVNPKTGRIFIADTDNEHKALKSVTTVDMAAFDWSSWAGISSFGTTSAPSLVTLSPGGGVLYVLEPTAKMVEAFSAPAYKTAGSYSTGNLPADIALSPDGSRLYVSNTGDNTVTAIDLTTGTPFAGSPIKAGNRPSGLMMGVQPQGNISINNSELRSRISTNLKANTRLVNVLPKSTGNASNGSMSGGMVLIDPDRGTFTRVVLTDMTPQANASDIEPASTVTPTPGATPPGDNKTGPENQQQATPATTMATPTGSATPPGASAVPGFGWIMAISGITVVALIGLRRS
ncbi:hypothetical protein [Methanocella sp. MCL-LM]|uniref:YncE family protein n=1 Tax=Methanocella sp. MCL-LM TaxID=3412035 RepID=UPI003C7557D3